TSTITVSNAGPLAAKGVQFFDPLGTAERIISIAQTSGPTFLCTVASVGTDEAICSIAFLKSGASAQFTLVTHIASNLVDGTVSGDTATVASNFPADTPDPNLSNNTFASQTVIGQGAGGGTGSGGTTGGSPGAIPELDSFVLFGVGVLA